MAAYCRVSTDQEEQLSSYENQVNYYTNYIMNHPNYELIGVYADEGITGTSTKKRENFKKMIADCEAGKIDRIIVKSISRFARNTLDCLNYVRRLKELGIGVTFEKENIDTLDAKGEVLLTILSSLAQDESRSISENSTWGIRKRFEQGHLHVNTTKFMGYDKDENGNLIINEEQAETVRLIYDKYLRGRNYFSIAKELNEAEIPGWNGEVKWIASTIEKMLHNEKYKGDALLQKTYTVDFLTKKRDKNNGQVAQYYVADSHPAIITPEVWEAVQLEEKRRKEFMKAHRIKAFSSNIGENPFASKVICGECGEAFGRKKWRPRLGEYRSVWQCNARYREKGVMGCANRHIDESTLEQVFIKSWNALMENKDACIKKWHQLQKGKNPLQAYRAEKLLEYADKEVLTFDAEQMHVTLECIVIYETEKISVRYLDGTIVELK
ncbi:recombinase family protein [Bariatricus sp. SGI.161]|uniref:recombinase family protein n=1 Tax=Bariatricus sp. SGI.161 TaxID=3420550 RepID=UPI003CFE9667